MKQMLMSVGIREKKHPWNASLNYLGQCLKAFHGANKKVLPRMIESMFRRGKTVSKNVRPTKINEPKFSESTLNRAMQL